MSFAALIISGGIVAICAAAILASYLIDLMDDGDE